MLKVLGHMSNLDTNKYGVDFVLITKSHIEYGINIMNRIYRVVWCHIRQTHVVASELASRKKSNGKSSSLLKPIVVGMIFAFSSAGISLAATGDKGGIGSGTAISPTNSECGGDRWGNNKEANAQQKGNIAIGCEASAQDSVNTFMVSSLP